MNLYYEEYSGLSKQDTWFLHGNLASHRWWGPTVSQWTKAGSLGEASLFASDWRGCGRNEDWPQDKAFTLEELALDQLHLLDRLGLQNIALVGHSLGGLIALQMILLRPELFSRVVLLDSVGAKGVIFDDSMYEAFRQMAQSADLTKNVILNTIQNSENLAETFKADIAVDAFKAVKGIGPAILEILKNIDLSHDLSKVSIPTLIIHGEKDQIIPATEAVELSRLIPQAQLELRPTQGHCWNVEDPQAFATKLRQWL